MPTLPLAVRLRKRIHREVAEAQDLMVLGAYDALPEAVLHGGTAIWRCYGGNRFSEDVDFYLPPSAKGKARELSQEFRRRGLAEQKLRLTANTVFAKFGEGASAVRFEATFRRVGDVVVVPYEMVDGVFAAVRTLRPEALLKEKALAYLGRRKVRDLFDVYFLAHVVGPGGEARGLLRALSSPFRPPLDAASLSAIVITGSTPTVSDMREAIEAWAR